MDWRCRLGWHNWIIIWGPTGPRYMCSRCGRAR